MQRKKILVADDQDYMRSLVSKYLTREGFEVIEAADGYETLKKVAEFHPDLLVLDVVMPEMSGFEVLKRLQSVPGTRDIPVVLLTAKAESEDRIQGLSLGAHDYVSKPFSLDELRLRINRLLDFKERIAKLVDYSQRDELTGLPRRSYFEISLKELIANQERDFGVVLLVLEGLDEVTAEAGLEAVDATLQAAASAMLDLSDNQTEVFWVGPAHAAILQTRTDRSRLERLANMARAAVARAVCKGKDSPKIRVSARWAMHEGENLDTFMAKVAGGSDVFSLSESSEQAELAKVIPLPAKRLEATEDRPGSAE
jgi:DNA-binding response OmpR family regulator